MKKVDGVGGPLNILWVYNDLPTVLKSLNNILARSHLFPTCGYTKQELFIEQQEHKQLLKLIYENILSITRLM